MIDIQIDDYDAFKKEDNVSNENDNHLKLHLEDADDEEGKESPPPYFTRMAKKKSTFVDMKKAKEEADQLLKGKDPNNAKSNLLFDEKKISIFRLYGHLNRPVDYFFMILALIGSLGSGISMPLQAYISSDLFSEVGNTSESITPDQIVIMMQLVEKTFDKQIKRFLIFGSIAFVCNFLSIAFWNLVGQRDIHHLKFKYFSIILGQEQGWFDQNNAFEFATKVQAQLEQVEQGIGDKLGNIFMSIAQCITGFVIAFITSRQYSFNITINY